MRALVGPPARYFHQSQRLLHCLLLQTHSGVVRRQQVRYVPSHLASLDGGICEVSLRSPSFTPLSLTVC